MSNMSLINVNSALAPLTQQGYLNRLVRPSLEPENVWRKAASTDAENFPHQAGMPEVISVRGLLTPNLTPNNVSSFTDPLGGMTVGNAVQYEQYLGKFDRYDHLLSVDTEGEDFAIVRQFEENFISLALYGAQVSDFLARNALFTTYTGGNTFLTANANSSATTIHVDNINGFVPASSTLGTVATPTITIAGNTYTISAATPDGSNASGFVVTDVTGMIGTSGTLTISPGLSAATASGTAVTAVNGPQMLRANSRVSYNTIQSGDLLTSTLINQAKGILTGNRAPKIGGAYTLYADNFALQGLYQDPEFQSFFRGGYDSSVWQDGEITKLLGVRVVECTSNPIQYVGNQLVSRPMLVAGGALTEFQATDRMVRNSKEAGNGVIHTMVMDNMVFHTRPPIDPGAQFITQAFKTYVGYSARTDRLLTSLNVPTASAANYKRAVCMEVAGV